jgi:hypothetical protein
MGKDWGGGMREHTKGHLAFVACFCVLFVVALISVFRESVSADAEIPNKPTAHAVQIDDMKYHVFIGKDGRFQVIPIERVEKAKKEL